MSIDYKRQLENELKQAKKFKHTDQKIIRTFKELINGALPLTKNEGANIHICSFFLPINKKTKSIYLIDHIKAKMWIPPGGHIENKEHPVQTVIREFEEELDHKLTNEKTRLFDLSITPINRPWHNCMIHYDFWYLVEVEKISFNYLKKEFYQGGWFDFNNGLKKISRRSYQEIIKNLFKGL